MPAYARVGGPPKGGSSRHPHISNLKFQISKKLQMTQIPDERTNDDQGNFRSQISHFKEKAGSSAFARICPRLPGWGGPPRGEAPSSQAPISIKKMPKTKIQASAHFKSKISDFKQMTIDGNPNDEGTNDDPPPPLRLRRAGQGNFRTQVSNFNEKRVRSGFARFCPVFYWGAPGEVNRSR
jgi:hypothetical protein